MSQYILGADIGSKEIVIASADGQAVLVWKASSVGAGAPVFDFKTLQDFLGDNASQRSIAYELPISNKRQPNNGLPDAIGQLKMACSVAGLTSGIELQVGKVRSLIGIKVPGKATQPQRKQLVVEHVYDSLTADHKAMADAFLEWAKNPTAQSVPARHKLITDICDAIAIAKAWELINNNAAASQSLAA